MSPVDQALLADGDVVTIGNLDLVFSGGTLVRRTETEAATRSYGRAAGPTAVGWELAGCDTLDTAEVSGCPAESWPTSKVSSGPTRLPMLMFWPSSTSIAGTRWPWTNILLRLSLSMATQRPCSNRSIKCAREISGSGMRRSAWMSRPITTSLPVANVCADPLYRTVSFGATDRLIRINPIRATGVRAGICTSYKADRMPHDAVSVIGCNAARRSPWMVMMWANTASTAEPPSRAWPSSDRAPLPGCRRREATRPDTTFSA